MWANIKTYGGALKGDSSKYKTKYAYSGNGATDTSNYNMSQNQARKGDAVVETSSGVSSASSWNNDYSYFPNSGEPFFRRGGGWNGISYASVFAFARTYGYCHYCVGFRAVLVAE